MPNPHAIRELIPGCYYYVYNQGNNNENLFYSKRHYKMFLNLFDKYLSRFVDVYAWVLIPNDFRLLIRIKDNDAITSKMVSEAFRRFFISYATRLNRLEGRTGSLFIKNFKRAPIKNNSMLKNLMFYIHLLPEQLGLINDFQNYRYSSFNSIIQGDKKIINIDEVMKLFENDVNEFLNFHMADGILGEDAISNQNISS